MRSDNGELLCSAVDSIDNAEDGKNESDDGDHPANQRDDGEEACDEEDQTLICVELHVSGLGRDQRDENQPAKVAEDCHNLVVVDISSVELIGDIGGVVEILQGVGCCSCSGSSCGLCLGSLCFRLGSLRNGLLGLSGSFQLFAARGAELCVISKFSVTLGTLCHDKYLHEIYFFTSLYHI